MSDPTPASQDDAELLANGVCQAYGVYNAYMNGNNIQPDLPGYQNFNQISVFEGNPNILPGFGSDPRAKLASAALSPSVRQVERLAAAYAPCAPNPNPPCTAGMPAGTPSYGQQPFGFTANTTDNKHNMLILRGTVTMEEAYYDLVGWGTKVPCMLPSQSLFGTPTSYGNVNSALYEFYTGNVGGLQVSLAASCMAAIQGVSNSKAPWLIGSHSLGGAILSLAVLDAVASGLIAPKQLQAVITFGSLHVGDQSFVDSYNNAVGTQNSYRIANLCDFVPSLVSLEPVIPQDPYVHVGYPGTFIWQTWDDWCNHSLGNMYMPMVQNHWDVIRWGERTYPQ